MITKQASAKAIINWWTFLLVYLIMPGQMHCCSQAILLIRTIYTD